MNWVESLEKGFRLHSTPLVISELFQALIQRAIGAAGSYTSATLTMNAQFDHFQQQLGLADAETLMLDSPYDFEASARLFLPPIQADPGSNDYSRTCAGCRSCPCCMPTRAVRFSCSAATVHCALRRILYSAENEFNLLVQGEAPRRELLERFVKTERAVLLGASSFWEGVDIRGSALSCVIIDKLPFAAPDDPVLAGRLQALRESGENPFLFYQLPQAVIALKQGVGRLIRDEDDYGVVVICDPRLMTKAYGKSFINSLPDMPRTSSPDEVIHFLDQQESRHEVSCN